MIKNHHVYIRVLHTSPRRLYWLLFIEHCFVLIQSSQSAVMTWSDLVSQHVNGEYRCLIHTLSLSKAGLQPEWQLLVCNRSVDGSRLFQPKHCLHVCVLVILLQLPVEWMTVCLPLIKHGFCWVIVHTVGWCLPAGWLQQCVKTNGRFHNDRAVRKWVVDAIWDVSPSVCGSLGELRQARWGPQYWSWCS